MSWLSQTWEMKWFSSIGKSWSCTIKSEFCSMHLVERYIIGDLFGWQRFQWQNYSVQDFLVMGNLNPANGDFGISESGVSWKYWKDFNKNRQLLISLRPNNRFADKKSPMFRALCCSNVYNKYWMAEWALKARKDIPDTHCYAKEAGSLVGQSANHNCWISANLPAAALAFCLMICSVENNQDLATGDDHDNRNAEDGDCNSFFLGQWLQFWLCTGLDPQWIFITVSGQWVPVVRARNNRGGPSEYLDPEQAATIFSI